MADGLPLLVLHSFFPGSGMPALALIAHGLVLTAMCGVNASAPAHSGSAGERSRVCHCHCCWAITLPCEWQVWVGTGRSVGD